MVTRLLESQPDILAVGRCEGGDTLLAVALESRPDVVILGLRGDRLPACGERVLRQLPELRVLGVTRDQGRGLLCEMRPHCTALGELSVTGLVDAIRSAANAGRASTD